MPDNITQIRDSYFANTLPARVEVVKMIAVGCEAEGCHGDDAANGILYRFSNV
jgi:hypothetical protein